MTFYIGFTKPKPTIKKLSHPITELYNFYSHLYRGSYS